MHARGRRSWLRVGSTVVLLTFGVWLISLLGVIYWEKRDDTSHASAIVVLGAAQYGGRPSPVLRARIDHAIHLWKRGLAPRIIFTGGFGDRDTTSEAAVSRRYALQRGVPSSAILIENTGRSTSESLQMVAKLMTTAPTRDVILVSDPFHMLRLSVLARRHGLTPHTSPTRTSPISSNQREAWKYVLSESVKAPFAFFFERRD